MIDYKTNKRSTTLPPPQGQYIKVALEKLFLSGDAYTSEHHLYQCCAREDPRLNYANFHRDLAFLVSTNVVCIEGSRIYLALTWQYEDVTAYRLANALRCNTIRCRRPILPTPVTVGQITLTDGQRDAVKLALSHNISMILGGAGTGKSTLITAISQHRRSEGEAVFCAPTGKAARNLKQRTGLDARTVHSALGVTPEDDFLGPVMWRNTGLVVVDEASMMTLEMLAGILNRMTLGCHLVLLGDPDQLLSVGSGNVLPDLLALGFPCAHLENVHRQDEDAVGLSHNVRNFAQIYSMSDLVFDDSFRFVPLPQNEVAKVLVGHAAEYYRDPTASVQVLTGCNRGGDLSVQGLNSLIAPRVNVRNKSTPHMPLSKGGTLWTGDRVMVTQNDREYDISNGDVGLAAVFPRKDELFDFCLHFPDGRTPIFTGEPCAQRLIHAYAITVHKAQGSEYDRILIPITRDRSKILSRNWLYTAISRAKKEVILYGEPEALEMALQTLPAPRRSKLVEKVHMKQYAKRTS